MPRSTDFSVSVPQYKKEYPTVCDYDLPAYEFGQGIQNHRGLKNYSVPPPADTKLRDFVLPNEESGLEQSFRPRAKFSGHSFILRL
jgi:hypothetical protein